MFENTEQEKEYANKEITRQVKDKEEDIVTITSSLKTEKKNLRKLNKQLLCEHDFKLKQSSPMFDTYTCKKCKFHFAIEVEG